jgi:hypothetical protein
MASTLALSRADSACAAGTTVNNEAATSSDQGRRENRDTDISNTARERSGRVAAGLARGQQ